MGLNKNKLKSRKQAAKNKKIRRKEQEDSTGITKKRKGDKPELDQLVFYCIKGGLLLAILICYFTFSILLFPLFIAYISLYYFSFWVERKINRNFNFENQQKVFKMDSGLAFITLIVSLASNIFSFTRLVGNRRNSFYMYFQRIFSLSTGVRNKQNKNFGMGERPEGFVPPSDGVGSGRPSKTDFDISDLPIEFAFTQILSSIIQILIFSVLILGAISTFRYFYKTYISKTRMRIKENNKNEWVFSKEDLKRILQEEV